MHSEAAEDVRGRIPPNSQHNRIAFGLVKLIAERKGDDGAQLVETITEAVFLGPPEVQPGTQEFLGQALFDAHSSSG